MSNFELRAAGCKRCSLRLLHEYIFANARNAGNRCLGEISISASYPPQHLHGHPFCAMSPGIRHRPFTLD